MSFELFVQGFSGGDAAPMPSSAFDVFRPHVDRTTPEFHYWHIRTPDGGDADIYADVTPETFGSLMISRFSTGGPLDLLAIGIGDDGTGLVGRRHVEPLLFGWSGQRPRRAAREVFLAP